MTAKLPLANPARPFFGLALFAFGVVTLVWPVYYDWLRPHFTSSAGGHVFATVAAFAQIAGGAAIVLPKSARVGALVGGAVYFCVALLSIPRIFASPQVYDVWGNFFEQFSLVTGAAIVFESSSPSVFQSARTALRICFALCSASFGTEQAVYLSNTAMLVPKWLPPNPMFWAIATTVPFYLAAIAFITNRYARLAAQLLAIMIAAFGIIVWLPLLASGIHSMPDWSETVETFAIAGAAWVLADYLAGRGSR